MSENDTPNLMSVRCFEAIGKELNLAPSRVFSKKVEILLWAPLFLGTASFIYMVILVVQWFVRLPGVVPA